MNTTLLLVGIACVVAAVVGGGLKLAGAEFPLLTSVLRQVLLAVVGLAVLGISFAGGETVDVRFHATAVGRATADESGAFVVAVKVPATPFRDQQFDFVATGRRSIRSARAPFQVT